jgi:RNA polymerase sigma factor (sigma-70 family)
MDTSHWKLMAAGDLQAFLHIYESHYRGLFTYGFTLTSDRNLTKDCLQDLFLELWNTRSTLNTKVTDAKSYLMTWLRRKISQEWKRRNKNLANDGSFFNELSHSCEAYEQLLIAFQITEEDKHRLQNALQQLTRQQREMIRLRFFEKLSFSEIAVKTSLSTRTIYNLMYESIRLLRLKVSPAQNIFLRNSR